MGTLPYKIRTITCKGCGTLVTDHFRPNQRYCSLDCYRVSPIRPQRMTGAVKACHICGVAVYISKHRLGGKNYFCSQKHAGEWLGRNKTTHECIMCHTVFKLSPSTSKQRIYEIKYCSLTCRDSDPQNRERLVAMNLSQQLGKRSTLEKIGYGLLDNLGIKYTPQCLIANKFCVDAFIESKSLVIQFDGDYWHGNSKLFPTPDKRQIKRMRLDKSQDAYMNKCGFMVLRIWEHELKSDTNSVITKLQHAVAHQ